MGWTITRDPAQFGQAVECWDSWSIVFGEARHCREEPDELIQNGNHGREVSIVAVVDDTKF
jgi:hypothetical protein